MELISKASVSGYYKLTKLSSSGEVVHTSEFKNLLLNEFYKKANGSVSDLFSRCYVGTGTTEPVVTDTSLERIVADTSSRSNLRAARVADLQTSTINEVVGSKFTFPLGAINTNITEIGIRHRVTNTFTTRALIKDELGNPASLSVDIGEQLIVEHRLFVNDIPMSGSDTVNIKNKEGVVIDTVDVEYTLFGPGFGNAKNTHYNVTNTDWAFAGWGLPSDYSMVLVPNGVVINPVYGQSVADSGYTGDFEYLQVGVSQKIVGNKLLAVKRINTASGNQPGGIKQLITNPNGGRDAGVFWCITFSKPIPKTNLNIFEFTLSSEVTEVI